MAKTLSPQRANTLDKVCTLNRDNFSRPDYWIITDTDEVTICKQRDGESQEESVTIPKSEFDKLIRWYTRPQKIRSHP